MSDQIKQLETNILQPNPFQPRTGVNKKTLVELSRSIKSFGILEPLIVAHTPAGYQIIAGERRWRAAKLLGLETVPAVVRETSPRGMLKMALVENVQRVDLHPIERAKAFQQLQRDFGYTNEQIARSIGKSTPYVSNSMRLLNLPDAIKDGLSGGLISEGHARALVSLDHPRVMIDVYKQVLKEGASVRRAEELVRLQKQKQANKKDISYVKNEVILMDDDSVKHWQKSLQQILKSPSTIKLTRSKNQTRITITLKGAPDATQLDLETLMSLRVQPE